MTQDTLGEKLLTLAEAVVDEALAPGVSLEERLDALKTAGAFHVAASKALGKLKKEEPPAFDTYFAKIKSAERDEDGDEDDGDAA